MAHIYRAFFAPMVRMNAPSGLPTKVPFLFSNILRRLIKDYSPDYIAIVFDTKAPTFRDKLFEKYKEHRAPMPDELSQQIPYVRRLCEAMHLPILEMDGFEADDLIGGLAQQASKQKLDVLVVTNDKDMMQLVCGNVRVLRTGSGGAKSDVIVDEAKVKEILGCYRRTSCGLYGAARRQHRQYSRRKGHRRKGRSRIDSEVWHRGKRPGPCR